MFYDDSHMLLLPPTFSGEFKDSLSVLSLLKSLFYVRYLKVNSSN